MRAAKLNLQQALNTRIPNAVLNFAFKLRYRQVRHLFQFSLSLHSTLPTTLPTVCTLLPSSRSFRFIRRGVLVNGLVIVRCAANKPSLEIDFYSGLNTRRSTFATQHAYFPPFLLNSIPSHIIGTIFYSPSHPLASLYRYPSGAASQYFSLFLVPSRQLNEETLSLFSFLATTWSGTMSLDGKIVLSQESSR